MRYKLKKMSDKMRSKDKVVIGANYTSVISEITPEIFAEWIFILVIKIKTHKRIKQNTRTLK